MKIKVLNTGTFIIKARIPDGILALCLFSSLELFSRMDSFARADAGASAAVYAQIRVD